MVVVGAAEGDVDVDRFAAAYQLAHDRTVRVAIGLCGDRAVAEELAHDAWVAAYRRHLRQPIEDVVPYVHRAVVNAVRSRGRRRVLEVAHVRSLRAVPVADHSEGAADRMVLVPLLQQLPGRMRVAVVLRVIADLSVEQTADVMGVSQGAVKSATSRGLARLRQLYTAEEVTGG